MKRPATDPPEVEPFRPRRRFEAPQLASSLNLGDRPHPNRVSDDERALSPTQILPKANTNISQVMQHPSMNGAANVSDTIIKKVVTHDNGIILEIVPQNDSVNGTSTRRPIRRLKLLPPREPSPLDITMETDSTLNTPVMTPTGLRAPPCSPTTEFAGEPERQLSPKNHSGTTVDEEALVMEIVNGTVSSVSVADLFEPDHRPPTPPYYVQHFEETGFSPYEGDSKSLALAGRNANTYVRKAKFTRPNKRQKGKGPWAFKDRDEYPRGETPTIEMILGIEEDLDLQPPKREETESESEEDEEVSRDPGIAISLTVGIDGSGRFLCKWGACDKSFARNDHLGRHVRVSHLRVRKHRCEPCGMAFIGIKGLRNHEKTHNLNPSNSETAASLEEDREPDGETDVDGFSRRPSPSLLYPIPITYMFEPDGEEET